MEDWTDKGYYYLLKRVMGDWGMRVGRWGLRGERGDAGLDAESVFFSVAVSATGCGVGWLGLAALRYLAL
jgi:hypothetical protein